MTLVELLTRLKDENIRLKLVGEKVKVFDPAKAINLEYLELIKRHKGELIALLSEGKGYATADFSYSTLSAEALTELQREYLDIENLYVATPMQTGMIFHGLLDGSGSSYTTQIFCYLQGEIDTEAFIRAWQMAVDRHDILRTCFVGLDTPQVHQLVQRSVKLPVTLEDWRNVAEEEQAERIEKFRADDKRRGVDFARPPLMRLALIRLSETRFYFLWTHHHVLLDGWCNPVVFAEVLTCYRSLLAGVAPRLPALEPFERYVAWLSKQDKKAAEDFWRDHLAGISGPTDVQLARARGGDEEGVHSHTLTLSKALSEKLNVLVKEAQCTLNVVVQAAWGYLLHRYSGERDVVFGSTISGRPAELPGVERMLGLFINTIPVRVSFSPTLTVGELLREIHRNNVARGEFSYLSLADIQRISGAAKGGALFDTLLVFENYPKIDGAGTKAANDVRFSLEDVDLHSHSNYGISITANQGSARLSFVINAQRKKYSSEMVAALSGHLQQILTSLVSGGLAAAVAQLELLSEGERRRLLTEWNATEAEYPRDKCVHELFEEQAARTPERVAVVFGDRSLSYGELNERSNRLAHQLRARGVGPDVLVGLCVERSLEMMIGLLGILKAGGAYVPLDPTYPAERLVYMLEDSEASLVVTQSWLLKNLPMQGREWICVDEEEEGQEEERENVAVSVSGVAPEHLAYVIYTSGSTGKPKGVMIEHRNVVNFLQAAEEAFLEEDISGSVVSSSLSFDATVQSLYVPFLQGKRVELLPEEDSIDFLGQHVFNKDRNLLFKIGPSHLKALQGQKLEGVRDSTQHVIVVAGERLDGDLLQRWAQQVLPDSEFINEYGPTETTVGSTIFKVPRDFDYGAYQKGIPIGKGLGNVRLYVLDGGQRLQPAGASGELYIGGAGVGRGYLRRPELTAERFVADPFSEEEGGRLYRTGDLVRWLPSGELEFIGRADDQVKIRGFRIELGEIESVLAQAPGVREGVVLAREDGGSDKRLVAYVVLKEAGEDAAQWIATCKGYLTSRLPPYMVPGLYVVLDALPLTSNGKIDRRALPAPGEEDLQKEAYVAPRDVVQEKLCGIWQEVLKVSRVGIDDNFFALGGDSIISIQVVSRAKQQGLHFSVRQIFEHQTVASLAAHVKSVGKTLVSQEAVTGEVPLFPIHRAFFRHRYPYPNHYNQSVLLEVPEGFDVEKLRVLVEALYRRHDGVRLRFTGVGEAAKAVYMPYSAQMLTQTVSRHEVKSGEEWAVALQEVCNAVQGSLDIEAGPVFRAAYVDGGEAGRRLLLVLHHLVVDGVSWRVLLSDLAVGWQQVELGGEVVLPEKTCSLQQWGEALRGYADSEELAGEREYWVNQLSPTVKGLPLEEGAADGLQSHGFALGVEETELLLGECNKAYRTRINELLLSALLRAYREWNPGEPLLLEMEGHGREELFDWLDVSGTVGWFTTVYPLLLQAEGDDLGELIKSVKEQCRAVPRNGIGYGILHELKNDQELQTLAGSQGSRIKFNYLGQFDTAVNEETAFRIAKESRGPEKHEANRSARARFEAAVHEGRLRISIHASTGCGTTEQLQNLLKKNLLALIEFCLRVERKKRLAKSTSVIEKNSIRLDVEGKYV